MKSLINLIIIIWITLSIYIALFYFLNFFIKDQLITAFVDVGFFFLIREINTKSVSFDVLLKR